MMNCKKGYIFKNIGGRIVSQCIDVTELITDKATSMPKSVLGLGSG